MLRRLLLLFAMLTITIYTVTAQTKAPAQAQKKTVTQKLAKLVEPWPNADVLNARRTDAENRALFQSTEPLAITIESEFTAINKDRDPESTKQWPAKLKFTGANGQPVSLDIMVGGRGHLRRMSQTCDFIPLRLEFPKEIAKGTPFGGPGNLKLVTHCRNTKDSDQFVLREYLTYRLSNIMLPNSFRGRLVNGTYVDSKNGKQVVRNAMLLEDEGDVAKRMVGRTVSLDRVSFADLQIDPVTMLMVFEFMIGNTDFSIFARHNVILVQTPDSKLHPVPYDFDLSALVRPPYAAADKRLNLKSITDRLYRGPCRTKDEMEKILSVFRSKKEAIMAEVTSLTALDAAHRREVNSYLNEFFSLIDRSGAVKMQLLDTCTKTAM